MLETSLREIRMKREISQVALAEATQVSRQTIHAIETGKYVPSIEVCLKIARYLDLRVEEIFRLKKAGRK